ncbi:hypothetical protein HRbin27_00503 [bacterium HR27]|nr:hypothetical protein HRbin27_00503 [bacterium HR27]
MDVVRHGRRYGAGDGEGPEHVCRAIVGGHFERSRARGNLNGIVPEFDDAEALRPVLVQELDCAVHLGVQAVPDRPAVVRIRRRERRVGVDRCGRGETLEGIGSRACHGDPVRVTNCLAHHDSVARCEIERHRTADMWIVRPPTGECGDLLVRRSRVDGDSDGRATRWRSPQPVWPGLPDGNGDGFGILAGRQAGVGGAALWFGILVLLWRRTGNLAVRTTGRLLRRSRAGRIFVWSRRHLLRRRRNRGGFVERGNLGRWGRWCVRLVGKRGEHSEEARRDGRQDRHENEPAEESWLSPCHELTPLRNTTQPDKCYRTSVQPVTGTSDRTR